MWYNKYRKGTELNLDCGNLVKSIRNVILNVCRERHQSLSKNFFQKPIDKSIKVWYNKYNEREVNTMTRFEKDVKIFTKHLKSGAISSLVIKYEEGIFIIETDDEIFYYDGKTGRELFLKEIFEKRLDKKH